MWYTLITREPHRHAQDSKKWQAKQQRAQINKMGLKSTVYVVSSISHRVLMSQRNQPLPMLSFDEAKNEMGQIIGKKKKLEEENIL